MIANLLPSLLLFGCASAAAVSRFSVDARYRLGSDEVNWEQYKLTHGKTYYPGTQAAARRTYFESIRRVDAHYVKQMAGFRSFKMTINKMADLSAADYKRRKGYIPKKRAGFISNATTFIPPLNVNIPESVDWRQHGLVTPVKDQGSCGSCWSFAATGALEGQHARKTGQLVSLSEQNLVDCSDSYGNQGCDGGLPDSAFLYVKEAGGIDTEESYPYTAKDGVCHFNPNTIGADDKGFVDLPIGDEEKLKIAVATMGPISVAIDASQPSFQLYSSGVYFEQECMNKPEELDHAVLVVGYGTDPEHGDYWIVKNSWGEDWGEQGYIRMARGKNNHCGIASAASFPLM